MGAPLVLVHGLSGSSRWWRPVLPLLDGHDVRLVDVPRRVGPRDAAVWLASQLDGPSDLVGHSLGGLTCARLAAARPELVHRLVLVAPAGVPQRARVAGLGSTLVSARGFLPVIVADALRTGPRALAIGIAAGLRGGWDGEIRAPTLLVWGAHDRLIPLEHAQEWMRRIPHARLRVIADAAHVPMAETPSAFAEVLDEFLDGARVRPVGGVGGAADDGDAPVADE